MKYEDAQALVALIQAAYPRHPWPDSTIALYASELAARVSDPARASEHLRGFLATRLEEFPPPLGQVLGAVADASFPSFGEAWAEMSSMASTGNPLRPPAFSHVVIDELARQIGWENFRLASSGDTYFEHAARQRYEDICEREKTALVTGTPSLRDRVQRALPEGMRELAEGIGRG